jgi:hypothetical protein
MASRLGQPATMATTRFVALKMKIVSQYRERRDGRMIATVLEVTGPFRINATPKLELKIKIKRGSYVSKR